MQLYSKYKRVFIANKQRILYKKTKSRKLYIRYKKSFIEYQLFKKLQKNRRTKKGGSPVELQTCHCSHCVKDNNNSNKLPYLCDCELCYTKSSPSNAKRKSTSLSPSPILISSQSPSPRQELPELGKRKRSVQNSQSPSQAKKCINIPICNKQNSCYLDSLMVALFHTRNENVYNMFTNNLNDSTHISHIEEIEERRKILESFKQIIDIIQNPENYSKCNYLTNLRTKLDEYKKFSYNDTNWTADQCDPKDALEYLNDILNVKTNISIIETHYKTIMRTTDANKNIEDYTKYVKHIFKDKEKHKFITENTSNSRGSFIRDIDAQFFIKFNHETQIIDNTNDWQNIEIREIKIREIKIENSDLLFYRLDRIASTPKREKSDKYIEPAKYIILGNNNTLQLRSIIVHHGKANEGHYTCLFKCHKDNMWYEYDDDARKSTVSYVGNFKDVCNYTYRDIKNYYLKNCTNFVYY